MLCHVRTSSVADIQALVFLLIHSQNVNWITTAQINPRHEKMQISFYINQYHLWNNCIFLETMFFLFCTRFFIFIFIFFYLHIFILEMLGRLLLRLWNSHCVVKIAWHATPLTTWRTKRSKIRIFLFSLFPIYLCPTSSLIKKRTGVKTERTRVTKISRISWMLHLPVNWFLQWRAIFFPSWPG